MPARTWASGPTLFGVSKQRFYASDDGGVTWRAAAAQGLGASEIERIPGDCTLDPGIEDVIRRKRRVGDPGQARGFGTTQCFPIDGVHDRLPHADVEQGLLVAGDIALLEP